MSSGKFVIGGLFVVAAIIGSAPLFFHDYKKFANSLTTPQYQDAPKTQNSNDTILGTYNNIPLKRNELTSQELQTLYEAENQSYKAIESILAKRYFDSLVKDYMKKKNLTNLPLAEQTYLQEKAKVTTEQVKNFIKENADNPQLKGKPYAQQEALVKPYLQNQAAAGYFRSVVTQATANGDIEVTSVKKSAPPKINVEAGHSPSKGPENAPITIVEFADFQCPYCASAKIILDDLFKQYKNKIRIIFKNYPLIQIHPEAMPAAIAAECANKQNKYWQMHDALFENHKKLGEDLYQKLAQSLQLNINEFNKCRKDPSIQAQVSSEMDYGQSLGINATPAFYVNGIQLMGAVPKSEFEKVINKELSLKK
jgi:protein-disulfide isomerase